MSATPYDVITTQLTQLIESGDALPWERPWSTTGLDAPVSVRGHEYRGVNRLMLGLAGQVFGYSDPRWITFNQARERGGSVRKGEKSMPVVLWKPVTKERETDSGEHETDSYLVARYYRVFNVEQADGLELELRPEPESFEWDPLERCEAVIAAMPDPPELRHAGGRAYYSPSADTVTMPPRESFPEPEGYYGVLFHEHAHATGHERRLNRKLEAPAPFGSADYSREELVAEIASAFVCGAVGIDTPKVTRDHAAYVKNWLAVLRDDTKAVVIAAARASKAADWILAVPAPRRQGELTHATPPPPGRSRARPPVDRQRPGHTVPRARAGHLRRRAARGHECRPHPHQHRPPHDRGSRGRPPGARLPPGRPPRPRRGELRELEELPRRPRPSGAARRRPGAAPVHLRRRSHPLHRQPPRLNPTGAPRAHWRRAPPFPPHHQPRRKPVMSPEFEIIDTRDGGLIATAPSWMAAERAHTILAHEARVYRPTFRVLFPPDYLVPVLGGQTMTAAAAGLPTTEAE